MPANATACQQLAKSNVVPCLPVIAISVNFSLTAICFESNSCGCWLKRERRCQVIAEAITWQRRSRFSQHPQLFDSKQMAVSEKFTLIAITGRQGTTLLFASCWQAVAFAGIFS